MSLRYCLPRVTGRGAGLGNELISWARAFLASQLLDAKLLPPAFGLNSRRYWRHFGTPRHDWLTHRALEKVLPVVEFTEADYVRLGGGDFVTVFHQFAEDNTLNTRGSYVLATEGMWGGYRHIAQARDFVYSTLYQSHFAARNLLTINSRLHKDKVTVAMHVRLGDFGAVPLELASYRGQFNLALPLAWYRNIALSIQRQLGDQVQFLIVSDGTAEQMQPLTAQLDAVTTSEIPDSDCSDLLALANADLLVCSVSSYSTTAAFLSDSPYLWFEPNLQYHLEGGYSIWGHEPAQRADNSATRLSLAELRCSAGARESRGWPVAMQGEVNGDLLETVLSNKRLKNSASDLIQYGVVASLS
jgi:hypothetical protein